MKMQQGNFAGCTSVRMYIEEMYSTKICFWEKKKFSNNLEFPPEVSRERRANETQTKQQKRTNKRQNIKE